MATTATSIKNHSSLPYVPLMHQHREHDYFCRVVLTDINAIIATEVLQQLTQKSDIEYYYSWGFWLHQLGGAKALAQNFGHTYLFAVSN